MIQSNAEYHSTKAIGSTSLKLGLIDSWTLYNRSLFTMKQTTSMKLGSATHELLAKMIDPSTVLEYSENNRGLGEFTLTSTEMTKARKMANNAFTMFGSLLKGAEVEQSFYSKYKNIVDIKCRPDYMQRDQGIIYDLKTIQSLTERDVKRAIINFHYDISAAFYILVMRSLGIEIKIFRLIFVESTGIGLSRMFEFSPETLKKATDKCISILDAQAQHEAGMPFQIKPAGII